MIGYLIGNAASALVQAYVCDLAIIAFQREKTYSLFILFLMPLVDIFYCLFITVTIPGVLIEPIERMSCFSDEGFKINGFGVVFRKAACNQV